MTDENNTPEKRHLFDDPRNVRRLLAVFFTICAGLLLTDFIFDRHAIHPWEVWPGFYAVFGFVVSVGLVLGAKELRKILMRKENYYDDDEQGPRA